MAASNHEGGRRAIIALGANLPHGELEGAALLAAGLQTVAEAGLPIVRVSGVWESPAWPPNGPSGPQPDYVNAVAEAAVGGLAPEAALARLLAVEAAFGRERRVRWAARTLDLDIIDFAGLVLDAPTLTLPHPRAHERPFVLAPLAEMAPEWRHPRLGKTASELLAALPERASARRTGPLLIGAI
ncbi:MAG: 2-amino-4-hydroxy-6-hydroxymethyldihydropteridine diphosphokinase [Hyphomonadaceae bacterium]